MKTTQTDQQPKPTPRKPGLLGRLLRRLDAALKEKADKNGGGCCGGGKCC